MSKMFKCEDGTVFPVNEVLSVNEASYYDYLGNKAVPLTFTDLESMNAYIEEEITRSVPKEDFEEGLIAKVLRRFFVRLTKGKGELAKSDQRVREENQRLYEDEVKERIDEERVYSTSITDRVRYVEGIQVAMKQWDVKIRHRRDVIRISHADYERLCAEMGK